MTRSAILAGLITALAVVAAPTAGAAPDEDTKCGKRGGASSCQKPGHASLHTEPDPMPSQPSGIGLVRPAWVPGYGVPVMPVID